MKLLIKIFLILTVFLLISVNAQKNPYEAIKRQGIIHMDNGKYGEAIDLFNKYITANPRVPEGYNLRALCYEKRQIYEYAVLDLRRAVHLTPNNSEYRQNLNRVIAIWYPLLRKKIEGHKRELAIDPYSPFDHLEIGKSHRWLEEWKLAELWYDKFLALYDDASPDEIIRYSIILAKTGSIQKGERVLKKWVDRYPDDWRLWSRYGYFTLWLGKRDNAANAFRSALSFKPFFKEAQDGLDIATDKPYMRQNEPRAYEREYPIDRAFNLLRKNPSNYETRFELVKLLIQQNRIEEAREQLNILKEEFEDDSRYKGLDSELTPMMDEKYSSMLEASLVELKQNPDNRSIVRAVADYYTRLQQFEEANEIISEYLELHPDDNNMKEYSADILALSGDFSGGAQILSELINDGYKTDKIVEKAANYYGNDFDYDNSIDLLVDHLEGKPVSESKDLRFQLAKYYAWNYQWDDARDQVEELIGEFPENKKYRLFESQLIVWTVDDTGFDTAEEGFDAVLADEPKNLEALLGLATIHSWRRNYPVSKKYIDLANEYYPDNSEITSVESFYNAQMSLEPSRKLLEKREEIGKRVDVNDYRGALDLYDEYFDMDPEPSQQVMREYASINIAAENYDTAIETYNALLDQEYDEKLAFERANAYLWKGDSLNSLNQFLELAENNPDNYDYKLGLANSYLINKEYGNAEDIYDELLDVTEDSTKIKFLTESKDMLPMYGVTAGLNQAFQFILPYNLSFIPTFNFFDDNQELTYYQYGMRAEVGLLKYFTLGGQWLRTDLHSQTAEQAITELSGHVYFSPFSNFSIGGSIGRLNIENEFQKDIGTIQARWFSKEFMLTVGYKDTDARLVLFSPRLIGIRLDAYVYHLSANYRLADKYKFLLFYQYFNISDGNIANDFRIRFGKSFRENIFFGYEYFYSDYGFTSFFYYSPQEYSTHSIWVDYEYNKIKNLEVVVGGEVGYAPSIDFIVGNIYADATYRPLDNLTINGRATYGHSYKFNSSYRFISIYLSAYWSIW